ncbi:MAG TPA: methyltransferase domain-containing protein, partial [Candidatus Limnocylindrales bacterium]
LDEIDDVAAAGAARLLDVGAGTGTLAIAAIRRWPEVHVIALDASSGMIAKAAAEADAHLTAAERRRLTLRVAFADDLGVADGSVDVAVSSFVLQLVPNRFRALREVHRVLRRGGSFAWISWLAGSSAWLPDDDFDDALLDVGEEARDWSDGSNDDLRDEGAAIAQMRRAGYADVTARAADLVHRFDVDGAVGFLTEFDEDDLVASLGDQRPAFETALRRRLARRPADALALHNRTVTVRGVRR